MIKRLLLLTIFTAVPAFGTVTQLTGTLTDSRGTPVTGTACLRLPVNAVDTSTNRALSPRNICFTLTNGTFPAFANVVPNDVISPANTYYQFRVTDQAGAGVFFANYVIPTGAGTFNIGLAIPTSVTTTSISFANPVLVSVANVFTQPQTFPQINSSNGPISSTGFLRLGNADAIKSKNFGNTFDLNMLSWDTSNNLFLGDVNGATIFVGGTSVSNALLLTQTSVAGKAGSAMTIRSNAQTVGTNMSVIAADGEQNAAAGGTASVQAGAGAVEGVGNGNGGAVNLTGGSGGNAGGAGGNIVLTPGNASVAANKGNITMAAGFLYYPPQFLFANLATPANGALVYCSDCTIANPCAGAGTGAMAKRLNGVWVCN